MGHRVDLASREAETREGLVRLTSTEAQLVSFEEDPENPRWLVTVRGVGYTLRRAT